MLLICVLSRHGASGETGLCDEGAICGLRFLNRWIPQGLQGYVRNMRKSLFLGVSLYSVTESAIPTASNPLYLRCHGVPPRPLLKEVGDHACGAAGHGALAVLAGRAVARLSQMGRWSTPWSFLRGRTVGFGRIVVMGPNYGLGENM